MALRRYHNDHLSYPTPDRGVDVRYPNTYRDHRSYPYSLTGYDSRRRLSPRAYESRGERKTRDLLDRSLKYHCDLGWSLDYATAWCYKYIVGNQTEVADVIDKARELEEPETQTPYIIFDPLDKALFNNKLKGMVHLKWKAQSGCACGNTSAPGVVPGIPRICIELNKRPFIDDGSSDIDDLLDTLIHQMIHAYFLVCCGAQPKGAKQDGRLADGLHFGVILHTIKDVTRQCRDGAVPLIFYASTRRDKDALSRSQSWNGYGNGVGASRRRDHQRSWVSIDPLGSVVAAAPADGQSHCSHDNRSIRPAQVKNWQVEHYSRVIDLAMDQKGDKIYDLGVDSKLVPTDRLKGPPSASYVELVWDKKRIMVPREKALKFTSLKKVLEKDSKYELKVPDCSMSVLRLLYDFMQHRVYWEDPRETVAKSTSNSTRGPPVIVTTSSASIDSAYAMLDHIRVFKTAESMKFEELQSYAIKRLYDMPATCDDPVDALKELYNDGKDSSSPIHAELHKWARKFLARSEDHRSQYGYGSYNHFGGSDAFRGMSNYEKVLHLGGERFQELYGRNLALKDDCKLVYHQLRGGMLESTPAAGYLNSPFGLAAPDVLSAQPIMPSLHRPRSWSQGHALDWQRTTPLSSAAALISGQSWDDIALRSGLRQPQLLAGPSRLGLPDSRVGYKYYGRDGRLKAKDVLTGERYTRLPLTSTHDVLTI